MSFYINPGELRTKIRIQRKVTTGTGSFAKTTWVDLGNTSDTDPPKYTLCKWVPTIKGTQAQLSDSTQSLDYATATIRYKGAITVRCQVLKDGITYQILDVGDPTQHRQWLQIEAKAAVNE